MELIKQKSRFHESLLSWYRVAQRPLPWRIEPSLYRTVVSELMAQQTQIKTMLPYFERWMKRFPDFSDLAAAQEEEVLKHWEGLGYYSRARNLHKLAKAYVAVTPKPTSRAEWLEMPGIGPYTSAAVASIVFGEAEAVVDGNVVRVLARVTGETSTYKSNGDAVKALTPLAEELLNSEEPGDHNQAMMELGATICLKRKPLCTICPVADLCLGRLRSDVEDVPKIERRAIEKMTVNRAWIVDKRRVLLHRIPENAGQLAGQYELPILESLEIAADEKPLAVKKRSITHRRIEERIFRAAIPDQEVGDHVWITIEQLSEITLSGPHRRWIKELLSDSEK